jgi:hypothetical protein
MLDYRDCIVADDPSVRAKAHQARLEKSRRQAAPAGCVLTLCDVCAKAAGGLGGCVWSRKGEQQPVPGWDAVRRDMLVGANYSESTESYIILHCPEFLVDKHRQAEYRQFDPERARRLALAKGGWME